MRLFLQINITDWKAEGYEKPLLHYASSLADDIIGTDVDTSSDAHVVDLITKLMGHAEAVFLFVRTQPGIALGSINVLLNHIMRNRDKLSKVVVSGDHDLAIKMLQTLGDTYVREDSEDAIQSLIQQFAKG